jgi:glucosamine-6-phosphate deaminase
MTRDRVFLLPEPSDVYREFATGFLEQLRAVQNLPETLNVILPIGPTAQYPLIAKTVNEEGLSLDKCRIVLMDEYLDWHGRPISPQKHLSFKRQFETFIDLVDEKLKIDSKHWVIPDPFDIMRIDNFISEYGAIQTCYGGIGVHGHIAFNEPPVSRYGEVSLEEFRASGTRVVALAPETITINALRGNHGKFDNFPQLAVTIGMKHILNSKSIRLFADGGTRQHEALRQFVEGPETVHYPITLLRNHTDIKIFVDSLTGSELPN